MMVRGSFRVSCAAGFSELGQGFDLVIKVVIQKYHSSICRKSESRGKVAVERAGERLSK